MKEAFLKAIGDHQRIIHKISRMYRDTREDQEDLFQEIVFQLWKAFPDFRHEAKVSTWIYRIALNTALTVFRRKRVALHYPGDLPDSLDTSAATDDSTEREELMYRALRQLTEAERAIISLYLEEYAYEEIAEMTGISENYVGVRINRIKEKLRKLLNGK